MSGIYLLFIINYHELSFPLHELFVRKDEKKNTANSY